MTRHEFLAAVHRRLQPRTYLEIGVSDGRSLVLSGVPSIGVDPAPRVKVRLRADAKVVRSTSDAFFAKADPLAHLRPGGEKGFVRRLWDRHGLGTELTWTSPSSTACTGSSSHCAT